MPLIVRDIIADARDEHPSFTRERHTQRAAVRYLSERHRTYYQQLADDLKDRLSSAIEIAAIIADQLVGVDAGGNPYTVATSVDGYAVAVGPDLVPYAVGPVICSDPFAEGFVLPADSLQLVAIWAEFTSGVRQPVTWLPVGRTAQQGIPSGLVATVTHFRLSPIRNPDDRATSWDDVVSVTVVYVPEPPEFDELAVDTLGQEILVPTVFGHALKWDLVVWMARREQALDENFPERLLKLYTAEAEQARLMARNRAPLDHRVLKTSRTVRNR